MTITLSPSDFAYLYDTCPRCWYLKCHKFKPPKDQLPGVFQTIDQRMKASLDVAAFRTFGIEVESLTPVEALVSEVFEVEGVQFQIRGKLDRLAQLVDHTYAIAEFKTGIPGERSLKRFERQVHAYEFALRRPAAGEGKEVSQIWLMHFDGRDIRSSWNGSRLSIHAPIEARQIELNRAGFETHLEIMAKLVKQSRPPESGPRCATCQHIKAMTRWLDNNAQRDPEDEESCEPGPEVRNPVNPSHYKNHAVSPIELIKAYDLDFELGNVIKYVARHAEKNGREDLLKALWYLLETLDDLRAKVHGENDFNNRAAVTAESLRELIKDIALVRRGHMSLKTFGHLSAEDD